MRMTRVENNFNNEVYYTSLTGSEFIKELKQIAKKHNKKITDFIITKQ